MRLRSYVLDASVWINLLGTGFAERILKSVAAPRVVVDLACNEVAHHPLRKSESDPLSPLIQSGLITRVSLDDEALGLFMSLVGAEQPDDLGDGEAATLALAQQKGFTAVLDDGKARRVAGQRFAGIALMSTVDLLRTSDVALALGNDMGEALFSALTSARMRVLAPDADWVIQCVGEERARHCPTLRRWL